MDNWAADFEQSSSKPPAPAPPERPRSPPRDVNPFGQPPTPTAAENGGGSGGGGSGGHGGFSATEPPTPTSPPPPVPAKNTTATAAGPAAPEAAAAPAAAPPSAAEVAVGNGSAGHDESLTPPPTSPPPPPLPPKSSPRSSSSAASVEPGGGEASGGAWGGGGDSASPTTDARLTGRRKALDETRLFEQRRSHHFGNKFESDSLYWKCFVELIRRSQANNRRAISYAMQKLTANHAYAMSLYAIRDNIDGLEAGTTSARCEKERKERNRKGAREWPPPPDPADRVPTTPPPGKGGKGGPLPPPQPPSALDWLLVMEEDTAARTLDMCDLAAINVVEKRLKGVVKALDDRFSEMVGKGTACLRLMHSAETNSSKAHARYQDVVTASIAREGDPALGLRPSLPSRDVTRSDVWLADMNYRVAVTQQARIWTGVSHKLADLFGRLKDIEVERRQAIQGGLMTLLQLQGALLRDLPVLREPAMQSLGRINLDRQLLDQEVRKEMRDGATRLMATRQEEGGDGSIGWGGGAPTSVADGEAPPGSVEALGASNTLPPDFLRSLESPLDSTLIARSTMLERREKMLVTSRWPLVLAILTHDSYLLLFDVPKGGPAHKKQLNARTAEAFAEMVPKPEVDAMAVELGKHKDGKGVDSGGLPVPPSVAIDLSACQVAFKPDGKSDATFEITEIKPARGVKGVFRDYEERKFTLRGRSQEAMVDWVCEIKEMGRAGLQALAASGKGK